VLGQDQLVRTTIALAAAAALLLAGCSGPSKPRPDAGSDPTPRSPTSAPTQTQPPKPPPPPPVVHSCYRLGYAEALAPTSDKKPVPCTQVHTAVTFYVGTFDQQLPVDGAQVHRLESTVCPRQFATYVGGTLDERRLSMLRAVWFTPTLTQAAKGAHWFECTAIALRGDQTLARMSGPVQGVLESPDGRDHYALCGTAEPGSAGFEQRICVAPHTWKALSTVAFTPGKYPGQDHVSSAGRTPCEDAGRAVASNPLNYQWSYQWPNLQQWKAGQTYGVCWAPG
jgi:Septum formation